MMRKSLARNEFPVFLVATCAILSEIKHGQPSARSKGRKKEGGEVRSRESFSCQERHHPALHLHAHDYHPQ
jgi:hypothetical protein